MTENFKVVKNKYKKLAVISAVALGVFCGVIVACTLLLAFKLSAIELLWVYYLLIGAGVAVACFFPFYLLLKPNDKRLAVKLDKEFNLNQKVQTMVEYSGREGTLVNLQREQTDLALEAAAKSRPDFKGLLKFLFIPVIAVAIACAGIIVPAKKTTVIVPQFKLTQIQRTALNNLIADVNASNFSSGLKVATTTALSDMLADLEQTTIFSEMKRKVVSTVKGIDAIIASTNSYLPVYGEFAGNEYTKPFASAVVHGVAYYKSTSSSVIKSLNGVTQQSEKSNEAITELLVEWKDGVKEIFRQPSQNGAEAPLLTVPEMVQKVTEYSDAFSNGLEKVEFNGENDGLINAIKAFAADIVTVNPAWGAEDYVGEVERKCAAFISPAVEDALFTQTYSCLMDEFIRNRTIEILGLKYSDVGANTNVVPEVVDEDGDGNGDENHGGGFGSGDINYGSDEMVLDPDTGELVQYGTLLARYRAKIKERIAEFEELANKENATAEEKAEAKYVQGELSRYVTQYLERLNKNNEE